MKTTREALLELIDSWGAKVADIRLKSDMYVPDERTYQADAIEVCIEEAVDILRNPFVRDNP